MGPTTRRRMLALAGATTATTFTGCLGGGGGSGDDGDGTQAGGGDGSAGGDASTTQAGGSGEAGGGSTTDDGPDDSPGPDCTRLTGQPTPYDTAATPFIFRFEYVDSWELPEALQGPGGRSQGISSPVVTVDGETERAGIRVGQPFEALTATEVDENISEAVSGEYTPFAVVRELEYAGETVRVVGLPDAELPSYRFWLPHGTETTQYYPIEVDTLTSILQTGEAGADRLLCVESTVAAVETIVTSLEPNPETTIDEF